MKLEEIFKDEMKPIFNPQVREFIISCNKLVPDYFWSWAASTTGKYHPKVSLGRQGLIRHTKLAVWWGVRLWKCWPNTYKNMLDEIIASLILHDIQKNGDIHCRPDNITKIHGVLLADKIEQLIKIPKGSPAIFNRIIAAIAGHMGIWTDTQFETFKPQYHHAPYTKMLCYIVHLADYCAAQKCDEKMRLLLSEGK